MIKIKHLTLKNFLSVGAVTQALRLDEDSITLVLGSNSDANGGVTRNGAGKAQPMDALVKTPFGWKRMGDIRVGDIVDTPSGRYSKVDGVFPQGRIPVYRFTFADGRVTEACGDHIWKVWAKNGEWKWSTKTTKDLIEHINGTSSRRAYIPLISDVSTTNADLPLDPRLMGILIGDGYMSGLSFSTTDQEIADYVMTTIPDDYQLTQRGVNFRISRGPGKKGHNCRLRQILAFYGLTNTKSDTKFIPQVYKDGSLEQRLALLSGLLDTDGHVGKNGEISYTTVSERLCEDVCEIVRSIGGIASVTQRYTQFTYKGEKKTGKLSYTIRIRYRDPRSLVRLPRKLERISEDHQYASSLRLEIKSIEYVGEKQAQCISIDDVEHLYITDNYVVTHNTTVLQAISYAIYGKPITKIKIPNLINNINGKAMLVTMEFERDGKSYKIERGKKPDVMKFYVNDEEQKLETDETQGENRHTQHEIERLIGMSHTLFKHVVALNTFNEPFLKMGAKDQRDIIEELLGVTQISQRADQLKKLINFTREDIRQQEANIKATTEANERIQATIRQAIQKRNAWDHAHDTRIGQLAGELEETISIDFDKEIADIDALEEYLSKERELKTVLDEAQRELALLERESQAVEQELAALKRDKSSSISAQIARLEGDMDRRRREAERHRAKVATISSTIETNRTDLYGADDSICPCCQQGLKGTAHLQQVKDNLQAQIVELEEEMAREEKQAIELELEADGLVEEIAKIKAEAEEAKQELQLKVIAKEQELTDRTALVLSQKKTVEKAFDAMARLGTKPNAGFKSRDDVYRVRQMRDSLERDLEEEMRKENPHVSQIKDLEETITTVDYEPLNALSDLLKHQDFLLKLLTGKDSFIRKRIIDQNLAYLNQRLNSYLEKLGLPHEVAFQSDLTVDITLLGRDFDFEQLSRGEMNRVIMATSWAFRDVWESMNCSMNLLWVDELLDQGTDGQGVEAALGILKSMARDRGKNVFLISHREELQARIDRTLLVRKENGFTTLEADATL